MMNAVFGGMLLMGVVVGALSGRMPEVSEALLNQPGQAVELTLVLLGNMCLWSGLMKVAEAAGLSQMLARLLSPVTKRLFRGLRHKGRAMGLITLNVAANMLGLGNAATPLGIAAMQAIEKEQRYPEDATEDMCMFVTLNTASLQIIPTTAALLRAAAGSKAPMEILPAVWLSSATSLMVGLLAVRLYGGVLRRMGR